MTSSGLGADPDQEAIEQKWNV